MPPIMMMDQSSDIKKALSKPIEHTTLRVNPNVDYGLWVIMICQCRFTSCDKCTALVVDLMMGENMHVWGQGYMGNLCTSIFL